MDKERCKFKAQVNFGHEINSCLKCGKTLEAHEEIKQVVHIWFNGHLWCFKNWEEAMKNGFYLY